MSDIRPADFRVPPPKKEEGIRLPPPLPVAEAKEPLPECDFSLVGQTLLGRRPFPVASVVFAILTLIVLVLAMMTGNYHVAVFAALPAALALTLFLARPAAFACTITAQGLVAANPRIDLSYGEIQEIFAPERRKFPDSFAIHILHAQGFFTLPARLNVPSEDVYRFLVHQPLSLTDDRSVPAVMANFVRIQESLYGPEKVWVYRARASLPAGNSARVGAALGLAFLTSGLAWVGAGNLSRANTGWFAVGLVFAVIGGILAFVCWVAGRQGGRSRIKNWRQACLVLSPGGMALVQGHLKGELKWTELRDVKLRAKTVFTWSNQDNGPGLVLIVAGATILLGDIYHRPLSHIYGLIRRFREREENE